MLCMWLVTLAVGLTGLIPLSDKLIWFISVQEATVAKRTQHPSALSSLCTRLIYLSAKYGISVVLIRNSCVVLKCVHQECWDQATLISLVVYSRMPVYKPLKQGPFWGFAQSQQFKWLIQGTALWRVKVKLVLCNRKLVIMLGNIGTRMTAYC
jgi:hypothetical protein